MFDSDKLTNATRKVIDGTLDDAYDDYTKVEICDLYPTSELFGVGLASMSAGGNEFNGDPMEMFTHIGSHQALQMYHWRKNGSRIYDLSQGLMSAFMNTSMSFPGLLVNPPIESFCIAVPRDSGLGVWNQNDQDWSPLDSLVVRFPKLFIDAVEGDDGLLHRHRKVLMADKFMDMDLVSPKQMQRSISVIATGFKNPGNYIDDSMCSFSVALNVDDIEKEMSVFTKTNRAIDGLQQNIDNVGALSRLVVNTIMYLTSESPDIQAQMLGPSEEDRRRAKAGTGADRRRLKDLALPVSYFKVGAKYDTDVYRNMPVDKDANTLSKRHPVSGHWKKQALGPGRTMREMRWIEPYWRGPDWAEIVGAHVVKVKERK